MFSNQGHYKFLVRSKLKFLRTFRFYVLVYFQIGILMTLACCGSAENHFDIRTQDTIASKISNIAMISNFNVSSDILSDSNRKSFGFHKKIKSGTRISDNKHLEEEDKNNSVFKLIEEIHNLRDNGHKKYANNRYFIKNFPDTWIRILEDGKSKKENLSFYEVPLIAKEGKIDAPAKSSRIVTDEDEFVFDVDSPQSVDDKDSVSSQRFLNIFQIVQFQNKECFSGSGIKGICLHPYECQKKSGIATGSCAEGYGICCVFQYSCGDQTSSNCSTFVNPHFPLPSSERLSCTLTINKAHPEVTQLKIEIVQLELQPPTNGTCVEDQFVITGQNINNIVPILCGINNDQHLYVEVGDTSGPFYMSVMTSSPAERLIQVRVCQLGPADDRAPQGCLQYHTSSTGILESFNYRADGSIPGFRQPGYTNNLNLAICIARALNTCTVTYSVFDDDSVFQISNNDFDGVPLLPPGQAGVEIFNCPDDFIVINGIRLCGERLNDASLTEDFTINAPITETSAGPVVLLFRTNGNVTGRGFMLAYRQNPCTVLFG